MHKPAELFRAEDLARRSREVLEAAQKGEVTLTSPNGPELVILPRPRVTALRGIAKTAVNLAVLDAALNAGARYAVVDLSGVADWHWLGEFATADIREFVDNLRVALAQAEQLEDMTPVEEVLKGWRLSAEILSDRIGREILCGPRDDGDFIDLSRPE